MEAAEAQLARTLAALTEIHFPQSCDMETRLDAYLQLEELLYLEDSEFSVKELQRHMPVLLNEMHFDLQHNALSNVQHAMLRCLSYFMHHRGLNAVFSDDHVTFFLGELVRLLFTTQDQSTYKLCLWGLTEQNFPAERHKVLLRTLEGLIQAVLNPLKKSRAIEVQALRGLHLLLTKFPEQLGVNEAALSIYVRPIASRLASSEAATREQAQLVLEEACKHRKKWSQKTLAMVQNCANEYLLPIMNLHMEHSRPKDAVGLWKLMLVLLKSRFVSELGKLNQVLYVPEMCMKEKDAAVRLMSMQAWSEIVEIFHGCQNWIFNKAVVCFVMDPINLCLEQEVLLNVIDAAYSSWRKIVSVAVVDFNVYCKKQNQDVRQQQNLPEYKFWFGKLVMDSLFTLMRRIMKDKDGALTAELDQFINFTKQLLEPEEELLKGSTYSPFRGDYSNNTTLGGSSVDSFVKKRKPNDVGRTVNFKKTSTLGCTSYDSARITSEFVGIAFLIEDIFGAIQNFINISDESFDVKSQERVNDIVVAIWRGMCKRIHVFCLPVGSSNPALRIVRMSIDFALGILNPRSNSAGSLDLDASAKQAESYGKSQTTEIVVASNGFGLDWQLQLLAPLLSNGATIKILHTVVLHPKSKVFDHITKRMEYLKTMYVQCAIVLETWKYDINNELQVDFAANSNTLPYLMLNLLVEFAIFVDDVDNDHIDKNTLILATLDDVIKKLLMSIDASALQQDRGLEVIMQFGEESIHAAQNLFAFDFARGNKSMLDEFVKISKRLTSHTFESQQNASLLLDLHHSREKKGLSDSAIASTANFVTSNNTSDAKKGGARVASQGLASYGLCASSSCTIDGNISTKSSASSAKSGPASLLDDTFATPKRIEVVENKGDLHIFTSATEPPVKSLSAPPKLAVRHPQHSIFSTSRCIYPDLVGCSERITLLYRHFPLSFRPFFSFYKVKTIGDLSALPVEKVRTFGLKEPVTTVRRALDDFNGRKYRTKTLTGSLFRQSSGSVTTSPAISTTSMRTPSKRPLLLKSKDFSGPTLEKNGNKRARRSLVLFDIDSRGESKKALRKPKLAGRVAFCLQKREIGQSHVTRPGDDSHERFNFPEKFEAKKNLQDKVDTYTFKLLQHLRRSVYYVDKLVFEESNIQSEEACIQTSATFVGGVITNYLEAHDLVSRLAFQLKIAAERSSTRCQKLLDESGFKHA